MDHSQCCRPSVRDAHIAEALRVLQDRVETMAGDSATRAEGPMTDRSDTGGIATKVLCCAVRRCFQSRFAIVEIAAEGVDPSSDPSVA